MNWKKISFYSRIIIPALFFIFMYVYIKYIDPYKETFEKAINDRLLAHIFDKMPKIEHRIDAVFDDKIVLLGYNINKTKISAEDKVEIKLYFQCLKKIEGNWKIFVHIESQHVLTHDHHPLNGLYFVNQWKPGEIIEDIFKLQIPATDLRDENIVWTGFFDEYMVEKRLRLSNPDIVPNDGKDRVRLVVLKQKK